MIIPAKLSKIIKRHLKYTPEGYKNIGWDNRLEKAAAFSNPCSSNCNPEVWD